MQFVSHRGLDADCFIFGKHLIHVVDITLVTLAVDVSLVKNKYVYASCKIQHPFLE